MRWQAGAAMDHNTACHIEPNIAKIMEYSQRRHCNRLALHEQIGIAVPFNRCKIRHQMVRPTQILQSVHSKLSPLITNVQQGHAGKTQIIFSSPCGALGYRPYTIEPQLCHTAATYAIPSRKRTDHRRAGHARESAKEKQKIAAFG